MIIPSWSQVLCHNMSLRAIRQPALPLDVPLLVSKAYNETAVGSSPQEITTWVCGERSKGVSPPARPSGHAHSTKPETKKAETGFSNSLSNVKSTLAGLCRVGVPAQAAMACVGLLRLPSPGTGSSPAPHIPDLGRDGVLKATR